MSNLYAFLLLLLCSLSASAQLFPEIRVTVVGPGSSGYYLLTPIRTTPLPGFRPSQIILDSAGRIVYYKQFPSGTGDFRIQQGGVISYSHRNRFFMMDSTFTPIDSIATLDSFSIDTHDMQILPNGEILLIGYRDLPMDLSSYRVFNGHGSPGSRNAVVLTGVIRKLDRNRNTIFEWYSHEHYAFDDVDTLHLDDTLDVDWTHFNAVEGDADGNILVSVRHFNEITKIDGVTGEIIWRLGGNRNQFTFENDPAMFKAQHDIRRLPNGNVTLLDNGQRGNPPHPAAAKEYRLDEESRVATLVWSHVENPLWFSRAIGNVQRLPNGNTLVNYGFVDAQPALFFVVDPDGRKVFEVEFADTLRSYRVFNYPAFPWMLERPHITCSAVEGGYVLDAGAGHASYLWSNGAQTRTIQGSAADTFQVFVPLGEGGLVGSELFIVEDPLNPCALSSVASPDTRSGSAIAMETAEGWLVIELSSASAPEALEIVDLRGRVLHSSVVVPDVGRIYLSIADLPAGSYWVRYGEHSRRFQKW